MHNITFISTIHKELGKCNADELLSIIEKTTPDVIFLEALDETYSNYDKLIFSSFGVYHRKLEIQAIQKYNNKNSFKYVPVLDNAILKGLENKYNIVCENIHFRTMLDNYNFLASCHGFQFLNSHKSILLQEEMRLFESQIIEDTELHKSVSEKIDAYENEMLNNIYTYCKSNTFENAVFMCGVAHRKSIIAKINKLMQQEEIKLKWIIYRG